VGPTGISNFMYKKTLKVNQLILNLIDLLVKFFYT
jgi:hypothetical protein